MKHWWRYVSICSCIAATAGGKPWPVFWQPRPPAKSMYVFAVDVLDPGALRTRDDDRRGRDPARDVALAGGQDALDSGALLDGHQTDHSIGA